MADLFAVLRKNAPVALVVHNNPDPDGLASAMALRFLLRQRGYHPVRICYEGLVGRAENEAMIRHLKLVVHSTLGLKPLRRQQFILLDCQPRAGNVTLPAGVKPAAVLDHHPLRRQTLSVPFYDVRPEYGACATILYEYLAAAGLVLPGDLATALFYAIASETQSLGREGSAADRQAYRDLLPRVSFRLLSGIEYPALSKEFIAHLLGALARAFSYKNIAGVILDELPYPDFVAEMADFLLRIQKTSWSICLGTHENILYVSVRSSRPRAEAGRLIKRIVPRGGTAGGHGQSAGAQIKMDKSDPVKVEAVRESVIRRFLKELTRAEVRSVSNLVTGEEYKLPGPGAPAAPAS
jgi:nanoRNase/pAp phosphatase (c-di-AMP/oligoRNAs hydrolase)